jgi:hypothetical protein
MAGARVMAQRTSRPGALIAARRLADDPRAAFRAVSGLILALFIFTVAAALLTTNDTKHHGPTGGAAADSIVIDRPGDRPEPSDPPSHAARRTAASACADALQTAEVEADHRIHAEVSVR